TLASTRGTLSRLLVLAATAVLAACGSKDSTSTPPPPPPTPVIMLSPASVTFTDTTGTSAPAPVTVAVTNSGGASLTGLAVDSITYGTGATGWLTATLDSASAPATPTPTSSIPALAAET